MIGPSRLLLLGALLLGASQSAPASAESDVKQTAERMVRAMVERDHESYMSFVHPGLIERVGGDEVFLALLMAGDSTLDDFGITIESCTITGVEPIVDHDGRRFAVVHEQLGLRSAEGLLNTDNFVLGVLEPDATGWKFLDGAGLRADPTVLDELFPGLLLELMLPGKGSDRFVPDEDS